jgi:uncharacterized protein YjdB
MKKFKSIFTGIAALTLLMGILTACPTGSDDNGGSNNGGNNAAITSVTISPKTASVVKGGTLQFTAAVAVTGNAAKTVTWTIESAKAAGTSISAAGLLTVAADETVKSLTVKAASTADTSKFDTATVTISAGSVTSVTISPDQASVAKGDTQQFTATVAVTDAAKTVTWSIEESAKKAGTTISVAGLLTVAADETLKSLTVKAVSTADTSKSDTATVTISAGSVTSVTISPKTASVAKGDTQQFTATVAVTENAAETVTWSIEESAKASGTSISAAGGLLTVAEDETLTSLTVKAASSVDASKFDTAAVTVVAAGPALTGSVSISGQAEVGAPLTANTTRLEGEGAITYQWKRGDSAEAAGTSIEDATSATYTLVDADLGKYITVTVNRAGHSGSLTSSATAQVTEWILTSDIIALYEHEDTQFSQYIYSKTRGGTQEAPATIKFSGNISSPNLSKVGNALGQANTYVIWDLSKVSGLTVANIGNSSSSPYVKGLVLPEGLTTIDEEVFKNHKFLASITLPASLITIGQSAFSDCSSLASITLPASLTTIGKEAFKNCSSLESITLPASLITIGQSAFSGCSSLASITLPASLTSIDTYAFYRCTALESITLPASLTSIGERAFFGCTALASITLPANASLATIGTYAFSGCTALASITLPANLTKIGNSAFYGCSSLTSITLPENASLTSIGTYAFSGCTALTSITLPENASLTSIGERAFSGCSSLTSITLSEGLTTIGTYMFSGCTALERITLPASLTSIGNSAFSGCTSLKEVEFEGDKVAFTDTTFPKGSSGTGLWTAYSTDATAGKGVIGVYKREVTEDSAGSWSRTS